MNIETRCREPDSPHRRVPGPGGTVVPGTCPAPVRAVAAAHPVARSTRRWVQV